MNEKMKYEEILLELKEAEKLDVDEKGDAAIVSYDGGFRTLICC